MRGNEFLEKIGLIAPEYIEEAEEKQKRRKRNLHRFCHRILCLWENGFWKIKIFIFTREFIRKFTALPQTKQKMNTEEYLLAEY